MANEKVTLRKGPKANRPNIAIVNGQILVETTTEEASGTHDVFVDHNGQRFQLGDSTKVSKDPNISITYNQTTNTVTFA